MQHRAVLYWQWYAKFLHSFFFLNLRRDLTNFSLISWWLSWCMEHEWSTFSTSIKDIEIVLKVLRKVLSTDIALKKNPETNKFESAFAALYRVTTGLDVVSDIDNLQTLSKEKYFRVIHADFAKVKTRNIYVLFSYFLPSKRSLAFLFPFFLFA